MTVTAWTDFVDGLRQAGDALATNVAGLSESEQADGYRALLRALNNQLGRFEIDRASPELVPFNGWRQKFFMDNPDFRYWVADVRAGSQYVITGNHGDAAYVSITVYANAEGTTAMARLDSDTLAVGDDGSFTVAVGGAQPATGNWLDLPAGATALWVRYFHDDVRADTIGWCAIAPATPAPAAPALDAERFAHQLRRLGSTMAFVPGVFAHATTTDLATPNEIRHWSEMTGGAAFTEPGISYLRGGWQLGPGEALVIEGPVATCRYWNVLLYSRFLNSLDHAARPVSYTGNTAHVDEGRYRFVLAGEDPGPGRFDWLDTEGRDVGIVVFRWLQAVDPPELPTVTVARVDDLGAWR